MRYFVFLSVTWLLAACAHTPRCANPEGARIVLSGEDTCLVRIRQVSVGTDLKIPESLKGPTLSEFTLDWAESRLVDGRIEFGHFVLLPASQVNAGGK